MTDFPTVGLKVDLTGFGPGETAAAKLKKSFDAVGDAAEAASEKISKSGRKTVSSNSEVVKSETAKAETTKRARTSEAAADAKATREAEKNRRYLQQVRIRSFQMEEAARKAATIAQAQAAAKVVADAEKAVRAHEKAERAATKASETARRSETKAAAKAASDQEAIEKGILAFRIRMRGQEFRQSTKLDAETLAFKQRMWSQQRQEAAATAAAEAKAAKSAADAAEKSRKYLQGVRIKSAEMEWAAAEASAKAQALADKRVADQAEKNRKYLTGVRIQSAKMEAAAQAAADKAKEAASKAAAEQAEKNWKYLHGVKLQSIKMEEAAERAAAAAAEKRARDLARLSRGGGGIIVPPRSGGGSGGAGGGGFHLEDIKAINILEHALAKLRGGLAETRRLFFDLRTAVGVFLAGMLVKPVLDMADAMTALRARAGAFTNQASDVPYLMEAIFAAAQRSRAPLESIATLYTRLAPLAKQLGKSQLELLRISETVAKGFQIGGATPEEAKSSAQQLAQALASNRLGGDELRSLAENAPILMAKIAQALNMNTGQFIKWAHEGKANAAVVVGAIERAQGDIDRLFAKFPMTVSQSVTLVRNSLTNLIGKVNEATGASVALAMQIAKFSDFLQAETTINSMVAAVNGIGAAFTFAGEGIKLVASYLPAIAAGVTAVTVAFIATKAWTALMRAQTIQMLALNAALVAGQIPLSAMPAKLTLGAAAGRLFAAAMVSVRTALLAIFSPVNLLIAALTLVAIGINAVNNATKAAKNAFHEYDQSVIGSSSALQRAIDITDTYGGSSAKLNSILDQVIGTVDDRVVAEGNMNTAAERRLKLERLMAEAALTTAAADARAASASASRQAAILGYAEPVRNFFEKYTPANKETKERAAAAAAQRANDRAALQRAADLQAQLATSMDAALADFKSQPLRFTVPNTAGPPTAPGAVAGKGGANTRNPFEGALDAIQKMQAAIAGLKAEIASISANPLSALSAQIKRAGDEAAASLEAGDRQNKLLAGLTRGLAMEKERLGILRDMLQESANNTAQIEDEARAEQALATAQITSTEIMKEFWGSGSKSLAEYNSAVDRSRKVVTDAQVAESNLAIARRYGSDSLSTIAADLMIYTGASDEHAAAMQRQAIAEAAAAEAAVRRKAALDAIAAQDDTVGAFNASTFDDASRVLEHMTTLSDNLGNSLESAFGRGGAALGQMLSIMNTYSAKQLESNRRVAEARLLYDVNGKRSAKSLQIEREESEQLAQARIEGYADMAGAAASFFKKGSAGYKTLKAAEMAFRLFEFAMSAKSIAIKAVETAAKIGFFGAQAQAAAMAGAANMFATLGPAGFAAVAAMVAVLAGLGLALSGGGGGGAGRASAETRQKAQGSGSVLGDAEAKSESIARSLEIVASNTNRDLEYSNGMLSALRSIDSNISNLTNVLARQLQISGTGGMFDTSGFGLGSKKSSGSAAAIGGGGLIGGLINGAMMASFGGPVIGLVGAAIGAVVGALTSKKVKTTLVDQGLRFDQQNLGDLLSGGINGQTYADIATQTKKKVLGLTYSNKTSTKTVTGEIDANVLDQIGRVIGSLRDGVLEAATTLGVDGAAAALDAMVINLGTLSFKDMTGTQIQEALNAVFGKLGDEMATTALPMIEALQKVGEGAFETLIRVAREYQVLDISLKSIGLSFGAVGVSSLEARQRLIDLAGGIDQLAEQTAFFSENFLTDAERIAPVITAVYTELGKMGAGSITTKDQFKALVRGLDLTTEQGASTFAMLMKLAPGFSQIVDYMEGLKTANDNVTKAQGTLNDTYNTASGLIGDVRDKFAGFVDTFKKFRQQLETGPLAENSPLDQYNKTKALFQSTSALALTGDTQALADLQSVSEAYLAASRDYYAGTEPYFRDLADVKAAVEAAQSYSQTQVDSADQQLAALNLMVSGLITLNESVLTIPQALAAVEAAIAGLAAANAAQAAALAAAQAQAVAAAAVAANSNAATATSPTPPAANSNASGSWTAAGYLANNPDIAAAANNLLATADPNSPWFKEHGLDQGAEGFAAWHWANQGINEPGRQYAMPTSPAADIAPVAPVAPSLTDVASYTSPPTSNNAEVVAGLNKLTEAVNVNTRMVAEGAKQTVDGVTGLYEGLDDLKTQVRISAP